MTEDEVVGALKYLEGCYGTHPATRQIAEYLGVSERTAIKYLKMAKNSGKIAQREGHYMTLAVARAFDSQGK